MSHYLQTIVAKNMGHLSTVRPRLASRFEPPADTVSSTSQLPLEADAFESRPPISEPDWQPPQQSHRVNPVEEPPSMLSAQPSQPLQPSVVPSISAQISDGLSTSLLSSRPLSEPLLSQASSAVPNLAETDVPTSETVVEPSTKPSFTESVAVQKTVIQHSSPSLGSPQTSTSSRQSAVRPAFLVSQSQKATDDASTPSLGAPDFIPSPRAFSRSSSAQSSETGGPTIQVSIGRIDVRAITPKSSPPKSSKPRPAKPSLQDYLKVRNSARHGA